MRYVRRVFVLGTALGLVLLGSIPANAALTKQEIKDDCANIFSLGGYSYMFAWGDDLNNTITRSSYNHWCVGSFGGDDTINMNYTAPLNAEDVIWAGQGRDTVNAGWGNDWVQGENDGDQLNGEEGGDQMWGAAGADDFDGGPGDDIMWGGPGNDDFIGGAGDDNAYVCNGDTVQNTVEHTGFDPTC